MLPLLKDTTVISNLSAVQTTRYYQGTLLKKTETFSLPQMSSGNTSLLRLAVLPLLSEQHGDLYLLICDCTCIVVAYVFSVMKIIVKYTIEQVSEDRDTLLEFNLRFIVFRM